MRTYVSNIVEEYNLVFTFSCLYLRKLFCYYFYAMYHKKIYDHIGTTRVKRLFNLRTGIVSTNSKKNKE